MSERLFLLGVGAQKAGTSWVAAHLAARQEVDFGPLKEYHMFNALHLSQYSHVAARRDPGPFHQTQRFLRFVLRNRRVPGEERLRRRLRVGRAYADHFERLLGQPGVTVTGDMTPDYGALPATVLAAVRDTFARRGIRVRAMFVMRDPVERCISAVRMYRGRPADIHQLPIAPQDTTADALLRMHATPRFTMLTRYDLTLSALEETFAAHDVLTGFYEDLFTLDAVRRIEAFCGLSPGTADFAREVNASRFKDEAVGEDARATVAKAYRAVYADAARRYGRVAMEARWPGYRHL